MEIQYNATIYKDRWKYRTKRPFTIDRSKHSTKRPFTKIDVNTVQ